MGSGEVFETFNISMEFNARNFSEHVKKFLNEYSHFKKFETLEQKAFAIPFSCPNQPILFTDQVTTIKHVLEIINPKFCPDSSLSETSFSAVSSEEAMQLITKCE